MRNILKIVLIVAVLFSISVPQTGSVKRGRPEAVQPKSAARYIFAPGTESFMMTVKIWGEVKYPGIYEVPVDLNLMDVISAAGGPTDRAKLSKIRLIRENPDSTGDAIIEVDIKEYIKTGNKELIPIVKPGDTIVVPMKPIEYVLRTMSWSQQLISIYYLGAMIQYYLSRSR
ncbi:MAG: SLBB domain-containing protein [Candidatus Marinimicrobia bacterium]|nr:SLBB domain-containing protein [Candidatus Neomarinimicrobiota bacterium]